MQNLNMPMMASSAYVSSTIPLGELAAANAANQSPLSLFGKPTAADLAQQLRQRGYVKPQEEAMSTRRLVKVVIADPDDRLPLDKSLIYSGEEKFTDATDQELFFEIDIKTLLDKHNQIRMTIRDKKVKEREEFLEPAKIRDLKMVVVNIAQF